MVCHFRPKFFNADEWFVEKTLKTIRDGFMKTKVRTKGKQETNGEILVFSPLFNTGACNTSLETYLCQKQKNGRYEPIAFASKI